MTFNSTRLLRSILILSLAAAGVSRGTVPSEVSRTSLPSVVAPAIRLSPGDCLPSQKIEYSDPVSGKTCFRMTTMGKGDGATVSFGDFGAEQTQWAPDSKHVVFHLDRHRQFPSGLYLLDVETGIMTHLAPGDPGAFFNKLVPDEVIYLFSRPTSKSTPSTLELRAVNIRTYSVRTIKRYEDVLYGRIPSQSSDGKWVFFYYRADNPGPHMGGVMVNIHTGEENPHWQLDRHIQGDFSDGGYWNPHDPTRIYAIGKTEAGEYVPGYWNVETGSRMNALSFPSSHNAIHPNGKWIAAWKAGVFELETGRMLSTASANCPFGHPFADPTAADAGWDARVVYDSPWNDLAFIQTFRFIRDNAYTSYRNDPKFAAFVHFGSGKHHPTHAHPQFSPDAKRIAFISDTARTQHGRPPGPIDSDASTSDLFIVLMNEDR